MIEVEEKLSVKAVDLMSKLHDALAENGYIGHQLEVFLVRILFCLFADDTGIFDRDLFKNTIIYKTNFDGNDLGGRVAQIFQTLNTAEENRFKNLDEEIAKFPYVNGKLFEENLPLPQFDTPMRKALLEAARFDWSLISPAVFGSLFQGVMNKDRRRSLGAHYTSEKNILKLIKPLFLDDLWDEFEKVKSNAIKLREFHEKISKLKFLDPACGCGNFLVISYRELRKIELSIVQVLQKFDKGQIDAFTAESRLKLNVDQFYGIEIEEFPARIAEVAMWLTDHQMNQEASAVIGKSILRIPLKKSAHIVNGNALRIPWEEVVPKDELSYILGNPPFVGKQLRSKEQTADLLEIFKGVKGNGVLDFVCCWYLLAAKYIQGTKIKVAFVSTNSISQGEQVGILWKELFNNYKIKIHFAHRTFQWNSEARGKAAVHVVIIGFANFNTDKKYIFEYEYIKGEAHKVDAKNINPYLVDADDFVILSRTNPIINIPKVYKGNQPTDGGFLILSDLEKDKLINKNPEIKSLIKELISAKEYLNGIKRWCLWLTNVEPNQIRKYPDLVDRISRVRFFRLKSVFKDTRELADRPTLFRDLKNPGSWIVVPATTSERRKYIPFGFYGKNEIPSNSIYMIPDAEIYHFSILSSEMHMTWVRYTCGRLESSFRYSKNIVYNNFPWPENISDKQKKEVEEKAQKVLDIRKEFPDSSLADLYDPLTMPPKLLKAHQELDKAVDKCYRTKAFKSEKERIEFLFERYRELVGKELQ